MDQCKKEPVIEFKDQEELDLYLKWWQEKLFLTDWIITARVIPMNKFETEYSVGENLMVFDNKEAVIHIIPNADFPEDAVTRFCQEKTLVHELLHCLYNYMHPAKGSYESKFLDVQEHQRLESLAKTLLMVKYGLDLSWFKRTDDSDKTD